METKCPQGSREKVTKAQLEANGLEGRSLLHLGSYTEQAPLSEAPHVDASVDIRLELELQ